MGVESMKPIVLAILFAIGLAGQTPPSCSFLLQARPAPDSKYAFTQAGLIALSYARAGWQEADAFQAEQKTESDPQTLLIAMMRHTKTASEAYACAETVLEPYRRSHDQKMIGFTADFEARVYKQHRFLNDAFLDVLRKLPDLSAQPTKFADVISSIEVERGKLWNHVIRGTTLTLLGLLDQNKTDKNGKVQTLVITRAESKELLDRLLKYFPEVKDKTDKSGAAMPTQVAALYYLLLTKPYKCADE
jgi:hypothetical protein